MPTKRLIALLLLIAGCSSSDGTAKPDSGEFVGFSDRRLRVSPPDLTSNVGLTPITITAEHLTTPLPRALSDIIGAERVRLVDESQIEVPIELRQMDDDAVQIVPRGELEPIWHEVQIDFKGFDVGTVEFGRRLVPSPTLVAVDSTHFGSRFHPEPAPVLRDARVCLSPSGSDAPNSAILEFSEPLTFVPDGDGVAHPPFAVALGGQRCSLMVTYSSVGSNDTQATTYQFACGAIGDGGLEVEVTGTLQNASGRAAALLRGSESRSITLEWDSGYDYIDCRHWHMP